MWEELNRDTLHEEFPKEEDWILTLGNNAGRLILYERTVALFWVMKNLIGHSAWDKEEMGEADGKLAQWWEKMTSDSKRLNQKMDTIKECLGMQVPPIIPTMIYQVTPAGINCQGCIPNLPYILL